MVMEFIKTSVEAIIIAIAIPSVMLALSVFVVSLIG